jgi:hypothetical protein
MMSTTRQIITLNPQMIEKDGKTEFVVLPYEEYQEILEYIENYLDLLELKDSIVTVHDEASTSIDDVIREIEENAG